MCGKLKGIDDSLSMTQKLSEEPDDNPNRETAFSDCARDYQCASRIVTSYMIKFAKDCNNDKVVDCLDYAAIHLNGYPSCHVDLQTLSYGRDFLSRYNKKCRLY